MPMFLLFVSAEVLFDTAFSLSILNGLLELNTTGVKTQVKDFVLQQSFRMLAESFIRGGSRDLAIRIMTLFATKVLECKIWIRMLDVAGFVNRALLICVVCFVIFQVLIV